MKELKLIVPAVLCLASSMFVTGCDRDGTTAQVQNTGQTKSPTPTSPAPATPAPQVKPISDKPAAPAEKAAEKPAATPEKPAAKPAAAPARPVDPALSTAASPTPSEVAEQMQKQQLAPRPADFIVKAEPAELDFGDIPTSEPKKATIKLRNTGDQPMTLVRAQASCGCTALKVTPNTVINPHEALDVEVQLNGPPRAGAIHGKTVRFIVEGQPDLIVSLKGNAVSFVVSEPATLDPELNADGKLVLKSVDGQPFRIMSSQPAVLENTDREPRAEHNLVVSFEKYRAVGPNRQLVVYLDHPKCQQINIPVSFKPEELVSPKPIAPPPGDNQHKPIAPVDPDTQLANLIKEGKTPEVLERIGTGLDVNYKDASGVSLLSLAAQYGNTELIEALLATKKVDIEATDNAGRTPLMYSVGSKKIEAVRMLLDAGASPSTRDKVVGQNSLAWAAMRGDAAIVRELIDAGSDVEIVANITGWTPLICAAGFGDPAAIDPLVAAHANLEAADFLEGCTPLMHAARTGDVKAVEALIKHKANLDAIDRNGKTALMQAAANSGGTAEKVKMLLEAGADVKVKDNRGLTALDHARKRTDPRAAEIITILEPLLGGEKAATPAKTEAPATPQAPVKPDAGH